MSRIDRDRGFQADILSHLLDITKLLGELSGHVGALANGVQVIGEYVLDDKPERKDKKDGKPMTFDQMFAVMKLTLDIPEEELETWESNDRFDYRKLSDYVKNLEIARRERADWKHLK